MCIRDSAASAWTKWSSSARRTCGEFFPPMRRITIKRVSTWHYKKMRPCTEQSNDLAPLSQFRSWLGCITNTPGYDFRKGHAQYSSVLAVSIARGQPIRAMNLYSPAQELKAMRRGLSDGGKQGITALGLQLRPCGRCMTSASWTRPSD